MATHWTDKRASVAMVGAELRERGWTLYGWRDDQSDSMTDYYSPASWAGVAERGGVVACVDVSAHTAQQSGEVEKRTGPLADGPCSPCNGTGKEPRDVPDMVSIVMLTGQRMVDPGHKAGDPCHWCTGTGQRQEYRQIDGPRWPAFQANPKGAVWHVEIAGRVLASGVGVFAVASERWGDHGRPKLAALVDRIEAAARGCAMRPAANPGDPTAPAIVRPSSTGRAGFVEVVFCAKPDEATRDELKAAGFRWSRFSSAWYGPAGALPARYGAPCAAVEAIIRDPGEDAADRWQEVSQ